MKPMRQPRSCGGTPEPCRRPVYTSRRPRVDTATVDHDHGLVTVAVVKGPSGFGFTLAESEHGQYRSHSLHRSLSTATRRQNNSNNKAVLVQRTPRGIER